MEYPSTVTNFVLITRDPTRTKETTVGITVLYSVPACKNRFEPSRYKNSFSTLMFDPIEHFALIQIDQSPTAANFYLNPHFDVLHKGKIVTSRLVWDRTRSRLP